MIVWGRVKIRVAICVVLVALQQMMVILTHYKLKYKRKYFQQILKHDISMLTPAE